ncbi:MAG: aspartate-semialdehyde dehydrogenase [Vampirovibrionales bacterium]|nr:aspartate-semialdehyde dehydrogenase [Vampirovibrionales bacterium]
MSPSSCTVAILGATGLVGQHLIAILEARRFFDRFEHFTLKPLASERSQGQTVRFNGQDVAVQLAQPDAFDNVDLVLASAGGSVSAALVPEAVKRGAVVVDNTSHFRMDETVPLVVAGVNDDALQGHHGIIANPNCSTAQLMPVLKALHEAAGLKRVIVSTYQSVSGAGKEGMDALWRETQAMTDDPDAVPGKPSLDGASSITSPFSQPIAFNLIPMIDVLMDGSQEDFCDGAALGYSKEEWKLIVETRKILNLPKLPITATAVRVPVMVGHSESVTVDLERALSPEQAAQILEKLPEVIVSAALSSDFPTPRQAAGQDPVYVGRLRRDTSNPETGLSFWVVADNLRIGAALNAVRIAERLVDMRLLKAACEVH